MAGVGQVGNCCQPAGRLSIGLFEVAGALATKTEGIGSSELSPIPAKSARLPLFSLC
jgi:hypothetical protein